MNRQELSTYLTKVGFTPMLDESGKATTTLVFENFTIKFKADEILVENSKTKDFTVCSSEQEVVDLLEDKGEDKAEEVKIVTRKNPTTGKEDVNKIKADGEEPEAEAEESEEGSEEEDETEESDEEPELDEEGNPKLDADGKPIMKKKKSAEEEEESEEEEELEESDDELPEETFQEDLNKIFDGVTLTEGFAAKAKSIIASAVNKKLNEHKKSLEAKNEAKIEAAIAIREEALAKKIDGYLSEMASEYFAENKLALQEGVKAEISDSFLKGIKDVFEAHNIDVPTGKRNVVEEMVDAASTLEQEKNRLQESNEQLKRRLIKETKTRIALEESIGLSVIKGDEFKAQAADIKYKGEEQYRGALKQLKESYFKQTPTTPVKRNVPIQESNEPTRKSVRDILREKKLMEHSGKDTDDSSVQINEDSIGDLERSDRTKVIPTTTTRTNRTGGVVDRVARIAEALKVKE